MFASFSAAKNVANTLREQADALYVQAFYVEKTKKVYRILDAGEYVDTEWHKWSYKKKSHGGCFS